MKELTGFENWSTIENTFLWIYMGSISDELKRAPHFSTAFYAFTLLEGETTVLGPSGERLYRPGKWIFPGENSGRHRYSANARVLAIRFHVRWPDGTNLFDRSETTLVDSTQFPLLTRSALRLEKYITKHSLLVDMERRPRLTADIIHYITIQELFTGWLTAFYSALVKTGHEPQHKTALSDRMRRCLRYLKHRPLTTPFYEKELGDVAGTSVSQICKIFIQEVGITPQKYWNNRRLQTAYLELSHSSVSVKEIAYSLGFSSPEHFARWFSKASGLSPRAYRKQETSTTKYRGSQPK